MSPQPKKKVKPHSSAPAAPAAPRRGVPAVFLDRDGTLTEEMGYINHLDRLQVYPWSAEAIRRLNQAERLAIVVTNQSGVARGYFTEQLLHEVHQRIAFELAARDARLDAIYYCPHHPDGPLEAYRTKCRCRKPPTGMVEEAARRFDINLADSYVVGDSYRDMQLGFKAGTRTILVMTGYGRGEYESKRQHWPRMPDRIAENLLAAVEIILGDATHRGDQSRRSSVASRSS